MRTIWLSVLTLVAVPQLLAQDVGQNKDDARYNAVLWTQTSPEYAVAVRQIYRMAHVQLAAGLANADHSADERQAAAMDFERKPPAIILDVDETVLDNSPYNARNIEDDDSFRRETWTPWVDEAAAPAVPGAIEFIKHARENNVAVFLVTNRTDEHRDGTLRNLRKLGLTQAEVPDSHLMLRNEADGRGGDKVSRRATVAEDHRIILLVGDNIADLCNGVYGEKGEVARALAFKKQQEFGDGWVMIPNPMYGGWERTGDRIRTQRAPRPVRTGSAVVPASPAVNAEANASPAKVEAPVQPAVVKPVLPSQSVQTRIAPIPESGSAMPTITSSIIAGSVLQSVPGPITGIGCASSYVPAVVTAAPDPAAPPAVYIQQMQCPCYRRTRRRFNLRR